jgi:hypothetical protein
VRLGLCARSHRKGWKERLGVLIALYPYRCWDCDHRFFMRFDLGFSHRGQAEREMEARRNARRADSHARARPGFTRREILFCAVGFLLLMGALWYAVRKAW